MFKTLMVKQLGIARQQSSFLHTVSYHCNCFFYQKYLLRVHQTDFGIQSHKSGKITFIARIEKNSVLN